MLLLCVGNNISWKMLVFRRNCSGGKKVGVEGYCLGMKVIAYI
jgi:hypothetical protein